MEPQTMSLAPTSYTTRSPSDPAPRASHAPGPEARAGEALQVALLQAFVAKTLRSQRWRIGEAFSRVTRLFRPTKVTASDLVPVQQLHREPGDLLRNWRAAGSEPQFLATNYIPAGWLRIRLRMASDVVGRFGLYVLPAADVGSPECLERSEVLGWLERELYVRLPRPALGVRFDPLDRAGGFRLEQFEVTHVPGPAAAWLALRRKLYLLSIYRVFGRTLFNGLKLLARGRFAEIRGKLLKGLPSHGPLSSDARLNELRLAPELPVPRRNGGAALWISGRITGTTGFDNQTFEITRGLHSLGIEVRLNDRNLIDSSVVPKYFRALRAPRRPGDPELIIAPPPQLEAYEPGPNSAVFTLWESDRLDPRWVIHLNRARLVLVPSNWGADCLRQSGVTAPIAVVPDGHDPFVFFDNDDFPSQITFGTAAALCSGGVRKNVHEVIDLFQAAFPDEDVRLRVKLTPDCPPLRVDDPRVEVTQTMMPPLALAAWYRSLSAFVNASRAEGFGLHLVEAMACARPVIGSRYSAVGEYFDESVGYPVAHDLVPATGYEYRGHWGAPRDDEMISQMRRIYHEPDEARELGRRAASRARRLTWKATAHILARTLEEHGIL
jgi:glycosyltransferase involved in cell wall biosynthesis